MNGHGNQLPLAGAKRTSHRMETHEAQNANKSVCGFKRCGCEVIVGEFLETCLGEESYLVLASYTGFCQHNKHHHKQIYITE